MASKSKTQRPALGAAPVTMRGFATPDLGRMTALEARQQLAAFGAQFSAESLASAIIDGDRVVFDLLLTAGVSPNALASMPTPVTPLFIAASVGQLEMADDLVAAGAKIDAPSNLGDRQGLTPLMGAIHHEKPELVTFLLERGASPSKCDARGYSPLCHAIDNGSTAVVKELLAAGADVDGDGVAPIDRALFVDAPEIVTLLLDRRAALDEIDERGNSPLYWALNNRPTLGLVEQLLAAGAPVRSPIRPQYEHDILWVAARRGIEMLALLVKYGADLSARDARGWPLVVCASEWGAASWLAPMLALGAAVDTPTVEGLTALDYAVAGRHVEVARALLERGATGSAATLERLPYLLN